MEWAERCDDEDDMSTMKTTLPPEGGSHIRTALRLEASQRSALGGGLQGGGVRQALLVTGAELCY